MRSSLRAVPVLLLGAVLGCSGESSQPGPGGGQGGSGGEDPAPAGAAGQGGAGVGGAPSCTPAKAAVECQPVTLPQAESVEEFVISEEFPVPTGGPLSDGEYELEAHRRYRSMVIEGETPTVMRAAVRIREGGAVMDYRFVEDTSSLPDSEANGFSAAICASGPFLYGTTACPEGDDFVLGYSAQDDGLVLIEESEEFRFRRR